MSDLDSRLTLLRQSQLWAYTCHFLDSFRHAINITPSLSEIEEDLAGPCSRAVPTLVHRLLYILTYDRKIIPENFPAYLRRQFAKRVPWKPNPLGTEDEPVEWSSLDMMDKLALIFHLCEWQFASINRMRTMSNDEEELEWRLEPIGEDSKNNTYWFIGPDRLWVQHPNPNPPALPSVKSKPSKSKAAKGKGTRTRPARGKGKNKAAAPSPIPSINPRKRKAPEPLVSARAARNARRNATDSASSTPVPSSNKRARTSTAPAPGNRRSQRNRQEEVWQEVPAEWLVGAEDDAQGRDTPGGGSSSSAKTTMKDKVLVDVFGDDSDLTDLSDEEDEKDTSKAEEDESREEQTPKEDEDVEDEDDSDDEDDGPPYDYGAAEDERIRREADNPPGFLEWKTVCITLEDWETFPTQFAESEHPKERKLYKVLKDISEEVCETFREAQRELQASLAVVTRKRSSRLAVIENERAAIEAEKSKQQEVAELHAREARLARREQARIEKETERERRAKEREEKAKEAELAATLAELKEKERLEPNAQQGTEEDIDIIGVDESSPAPKTSAKSRSSTNGRSKAKSRKRREEEEDEDEEEEEDEEDWELDCEICGKQGINVVESREITCCERCGKWQHVDCHDAADARAGRPIRNWTRIDFYCARCVGQPPPPPSAPKTPSRPNAASRQALSTRAQTTRSTGAHSSSFTPSIPTQTRSLPSSYQPSWPVPAHNAISANQHGQPLIPSRGPLLPYQQSYAAGFASPVVPTGFPAYTPQQLAHLSQYVPPTNPQPGANYVNSLAHASAPYYNAGKPNPMMNSTPYQPSRGVQPHVSTSLSNTASVPSPYHTIIPSPQYSNPSITGSSPSPVLPVKTAQPLPPQTPFSPSVNGVAGPSHPTSGGATPIGTAVNIPGGPQLLPGQLLRLAQYRQQQQQQAAFAHGATQGLDGYSNLNPALGTPTSGSYPRPPNGNGTPYGYGNGFANGIAPNGGATYMAGAPFVAPSVGALPNTGALGGMEVNGALPHSHHQPGQVMPRS